MQIEPHRWRLTPGLIAHLWKAVTRQHHLALLPLIARCVPRDAIVLDVGAHAGQFAKLFARCAPDGRVYAIEPASYARAILRFVVRVKGFGNIAIVPVALGAAPGRVRLNTPIKASGSRGYGLTHLGTPEPRWARVAIEFVEQTTIDALAETLALDRLDFIKADIEGFELRLLVGARRSLARFRPRLLVELNGAHLARAGDTVAAAFAFMAEAGYRGFVQHGERLVPAAAPGDGDFWFLRAEDPLIAVLTETGEAGPAA